MIKPINNIATIKHRARPSINNVVFQRNNGKEEVELKKYIETYLSNMDIKIYILHPIHRRKREVQMVEGKMKLKAIDSYFRLKGF